MTVIGKFIGINNHLDPHIPDLASATRDAKALYALFQDSIEIEAALLINEEATADNVRSAIIDTLQMATPDDTVILSFSGHGTRSHELVVHDSRIDSIADTTIPIELLVDSFRHSQARAIICILDCCFSGAAPAKVLEGTPARRSFEPLQKIQGKGRVLITASGIDEPAYESPSIQHGLLTYAIISHLKDLGDKIGILSLMDLVIEKVRALATSYGHVQTPTSFNLTEGSFELPAIKAGKYYFDFFPEQKGFHVGAGLTDLQALGIPGNVIQAWQSEFRTGLNELQQTSVNEYGLLEGNSLLVVAPTSAGKTFLGEMAAIRAMMEGRKAVFLFPYKALVNEKFERFGSLYGEKLGARVVRCTGDYLDSTREFVLGKYDIAVLTFEMFLSLAIKNPFALNLIGLVVVDEVQCVADKNRGIVVELILTRLRTAIAQGITPQLLLLSATIGDLNHFDTWLDIPSLVFNKRPVPLEIGVLDRCGEFQYLDVEGETQIRQLLEPSEIIQRNKKPSSQDVIVPLVRKLMASEEQRENVIVFRSTRGTAMGCARYLARELQLPPADNLISQLPELDLSNSSRDVRETLLGGTAFHNSDLAREERTLIEQEFRKPDGKIRVLTATTTVAAGVNTPASTVIIVETNRPWADQTYTVAEIKNMAGRAGRLGYNEIGRAIILAGSSFERTELFARFVLGNPEPIRSSFEDNQIATWLMRMLSQVKNILESEAVNLLANTYGGFLSALRRPEWGTNISAEVQTIVDRMVAAGLLERTHGELCMTDLGFACGNSSLSIDSSLYLIEFLKRYQTSSLTAFDLMAMVQGLSEMDHQYMPMFKKGVKDTVWSRQATRLVTGDIVRTYQKNVSGDGWDFHRRSKRLCVLNDWISGTPTAVIEDQYTINPYNAVGAGDIRGTADATRFHLSSAYTIASLVLLDAAPDSEAIDLLLRQLETGVPAEGLGLLELPFQMTRGEYLAIIEAGARDQDDFWQLNQEILESIFSDDRLSEIDLWRDQLS